MRFGFLLLSTAAIFAATHLWSPVAWAQEEEMPSETMSQDVPSDVDQIAEEIEKKTLKKETTPTQALEKDEKLEDFSGLGKLAPFSEISVIQKRFLPRTKRFELLLGLTQIVNDPWYTGVGIDSRLGYHFTENWGIELGGTFLSNSERQTIKDLYNEHAVKTDSVISTKGYYGGAAVWTPIYGKMGLSSGRIIPFDMYFQVGGGKTQVDNGDGGSTIHFGTGQVYALSKGMGFRWDFSWNSFNATPKGKNPQNFNNLLLTFGFSFFFPEAHYR